MIYRAIPILFLPSLQRVSLVAQMVKNLPEMQETRFQSLGWENPLEKGMAIHSSILAWRIEWTEEPGGLQSMGLQRILHCILRRILESGWHCSPHFSDIETET